jgi:poly(A) polymerase
LNTLKHAGFAGYLVGGCVRDLMLGREPKDFDVVTDARPEEIRKLFRNARLIGRRFRLAHVRFGRDIIEVATFRAMPRTGGDEESDRQMTAEGRILRDNVFGSQQEDALRRDFTVNALYYDVLDYSVIDYVGGVEDLKQGLVRVIGDPPTRFREDPVRLLRAVRFGAKLGFRIEPLTEAQLPVLAHLLGDVPPARMFEEVLKLFHGGAALETYELLRKHDLWRYLFPLTEEALASEDHGYPRTLVALALANTDTRVAQGKPVTPAFLFAVLLWQPLHAAMAQHAAQGHPRGEAMRLAMASVLSQQTQHVAIPRRIAMLIREIWMLQSKFARRGGNQPFRFMQNERFRAAYDFLLLRAETGEEERELSDWWTRFQEVQDRERRAMVRQLATAKPAGRQRRRRRRS